MKRYGVGLKGYIIGKLIIMQELYNGYFASFFKLFWFSVLTGMIFSKPIYHFILNLKVGQRVSEYLPENHQKKSGTPNLGGLMLMPPLLGLMFFQDYFHDSNIIWRYIFLGLGFGLLGFLDDYLVPKLFGSRGFTWKVKQLLQLIIVLVPLLFLSDGKSGMPFVSSYTQLLLGVLTILFFVNAINFTDGLDGLAASVSKIYSLSLIVITSILYMKSGGSLHLLDIPLILVVLIASLIPLLYYNVPPARVFMGDTGSMLIGAVLGMVVWDILTIYVPTIPVENITFMQFLFSSKASIIFSLGIATLLIFFELVLVPIKLFFIKIFGWYMPFKTPLHHGLEQIGWQETRVTGVLILVQVLLSVLGVTVLAIV